MADDVDDLVDRDFSLDGVEEADEFLMAMTLHVLSDDRVVEPVQSGEQRGRAVALVIVGHGLCVALLSRRPRLCPVECLDPLSLVEVEHDGVRRRVNAEPVDVTQFGNSLGGVRGKP